MTELLELTAARQAELLRRGELSPAELFEFWRGRAAGDELGAYLWVADEPPARGRRAAAVRGQGPLLRRGRAEQRRLAHPRGLPAAVHRDQRPQPAGGRRPGARQDEPGRVRDGLLERELGLRAGAEPVGPHARAGWLERRQRRRGGGGLRALGDRHGHRRLDPPARLAVRHRRHEAHLRRDLALRHDRLRLVARPVRPAHARRDRRRADAGHPAGPRPLRLDLARHPGRDPAAERGAARRPALRRLGARGGGPRAGRGRRRAGDAREDRGAGRRGRAGRDAERRPRAVRLLRDRAGRGERQPGPLRRRALRDALGATATSPRCTSRPATTASATRSSGAS